MSRNFINISRTTAHDKNWQCFPLQTYDSWICHTVPLYILAADRTTLHPECILTYFTFSRTAVLVATLYITHGYAMVSQMTILKVSKNVGTASHQHGLEACTEHVTPGNKKIIENYLKK